MARIFRTLTIRGPRGEAKVNALFDSGASRSFIRVEFAEKVDLIGPSDIKEVTLGDGETKLQIIGSARFSTVVDGSSILDVALVSDKLATDLIIGASTMQAHNIKLDPRNERIEAGPPPRIELVSID